MSWFRNVYAMGLDEAVPAPHPHVGVREVGDDTLDGVAGAVRPPATRSPPPTARVSDHRPRRARHQRVDRLRGRARRRAARVRVAGPRRRRRLARRGSHRACRSPARGVQTTLLRHRMAVAGRDGCDIVAATAPSAGGFGTQPVAARVHVGLRAGRDRPATSDPATAPVPSGPTNRSSWPGHEALSREAFPFTLSYEPGRSRGAAYLRRLDDHRPRHRSGRPPRAVDVPRRRRRRRARRPDVDPPPASTTSWPEGRRAHRVRRAPPSPPERHMPPRSSARASSSPAPSASRVLVTCDDATLGRRP